MTTQAWCIRAATPTGMKTINLPNGPETTMEEFIDACAKASRVPKPKLQILHGYPRKTIVPPQDDTPQPEKIGAIEGMENNTTITIGAAHGVQAQSSEPVSAGPKKRPKRVVMPGKGARLGSNDNDDDSEPEITTAPSAPGSETASHSPTKPANAAESNTPQTTPTKKSEQPAQSPTDDAAPATTIARRRKRPSAETNTNDENDHNDPHGTIATNLAAAVSNVKTDDPQLNNVLRNLRDSFRDAREQVGREQRAIAMVRAALAGEVEYEDLPAGSFEMKVTFKLSSRKKETETVQNIPPILLRAIVAQWVADTSATARVNLVPQTMALVSPRLFWSIVRHGKVGPAVPFKEGLRSLAPSDADIDTATKRQTKRPAKYSK